MSVIVAIFMGLSVSAEEIIKDRKILKREAFLNLSWSRYLLSKVSIQFILSAIQALMFVLIGNSILEIRGMYVEYWIVLFSAWASANVLGLLISDSFKTVVTIYILIPFLVIPQIILSGIIVKYEKLNPSISSPEKIPVYGEIMTARWAYEALATYTFKENSYMENFYLAEKRKSVAGFKSNYLIKNLQNKLNNVRDNLNKVDQAGIIEKNLALIREELEEEIKDRKIFNEYGGNISIGSMKYIDDLYTGKVNKEILDYTQAYLSALNEAYSETYRNAYRESNDLKREFKTEYLQKLKRNHHNTSLEEFVTNKNEFEKIVEFDGQLIQKADPIYLDPDSRFVKAHFYAPRKMIFNTYLPTI